MKEPFNDQQSMEIGPNLDINPRRWLSLPLLGHSFRGFLRRNPFANARHSSGRDSKVLKGNWWYLQGGFAGQRLLPYAE